MPLFKSLKQCRRQGFNLWFRKIPWAKEQLSPCTTTEPLRPRGCALQVTTMRIPCSATRQSLRTAMENSQNAKKKKKREKKKRTHNKHRLTNKRLLIIQTSLGVPQKLNLIKPSEFLLRHRIQLWRREWQPTPGLLSGKNGRRSLVGYSPWGHKESDTTERLHFLFTFKSFNRLGLKALTYNVLR